MAVHYICPRCAFKSDGPAVCLNKACEGVGTRLVECACSGEHRSQPSEMNIRDGLDLLDAVNRTVTFGGYNATQIKAMKRLTASDWAVVRAEYRSWNRTVRRFSLWGYSVLCAIGISGFYFGHGWVKSVGGVIAAGMAIFMVAKAGEREGHTEGYLEGYECGFDEGIDRALGLTKDDSQFLDQAANDMEIHERVNKNKRSAD